MDTQQTVKNNYFQNDIDRLSKWVKDSPKADNVSEILLPGEIEKNTKKEKLMNGVPLDDQTIKDIKDTAILVGIKDADDNFINSLLN